MIRTKRVLFIIGAMTAAIGAMWFLGTVVSDHQAMAQELARLQKDRQVYARERNNVLFLCQHIHKGRRTAPDKDLGVIIGEVLKDPITGEARTDSWGHPYYAIRHDDRRQWSIGTAGFSNWPEMSDGVFCLIDYEDWTPGGLFKSKSPENQ